jgi:Cu2+-exporting ATPase
VAVQDVVTIGDIGRADALALAAALEAQSEHPAARAIREAAVGGAVIPLAHDLRVVAGQGVEGVVAGRRMRVGRIEFVAAQGRAAIPAEAARIDAGATLVALGDAGGIVALFALGDRLRPGAAALVAHLRSLGITPVLLSGDRAVTVAVAAAACGIADARGDATPEDKRAAIAALQAGGAVVAMAGDGINDAPGLAQAQVSVSLGSATPLAQWTADVVVLSDALPRIGEAIAHARRTFRVVRQNLGWAFVYNAIAIPAAAFGYVTPLAAAAGMSLSSLVVVGNALRVARIRGDAAPQVDAPACDIAPHDAARI